MPPTEPPIACTLDAPTLAGRVTEIRALFANSLRGSERDGARLHLTFDPAARPAVEAMVAKEKACCAFLSFELAEIDDTLKLTITVPSRAADAADALLAPFVDMASVGSTPRPKSLPARLATALAALGVSGAGLALLCGPACLL